MKPSEASAARFLAMRAAKEAARAASAERFRRLREQSEASQLAVRVAAMQAEGRWQRVETCVPGAVRAWVIDVGVPAEEFVIGTTGRSVTPVAIDLGCYTPGYSRCRCHSFRDGKWRPMCHPPIVRGSSTDCDVCDTPCSECLCALTKGG